MQFSFFLVHGFNKCFMYEPFDLIECFHIYIYFICYAVQCNNTIIKICLLRHHLYYADKCDNY